MSEATKDNAVVVAEVLPAAPSVPAAPTSEPNMDLLETWCRAARKLQDVLFRQYPPANIRGTKYPRVEHWVALARIFGYSLVIEKCERIERDGAFSGWLAVAACIDPSGQVVGRGIQMCTREESHWAKRDEHQLLAMAQTRAIARAARAVFSTIMVLAGVEATPVEEMDVEPNGHASAPAHPAPAPAPARNTISANQQKLIFARVKAAGLNTEDMRAILKEFGYSGTAEIKVDELDRVLARIESLASERRSDAEQ